MKNRAVELVMDGGARMVKGSYFNSLCIFALLLANMTQAITPDDASVASSKLFQILVALAEREDSSVVHPLRAGCLRFHTDRSLPQNGAIPIDYGDEESGEDEVCLASYSLASELTVDETARSAKSRHVPVGLDLLMAIPDRSGSSYAPLPFPRGAALIHTLCRMTC